MECPSNHYARSLFPVLSVIWVTFLEGQDANDPCSRWVHLGVTQITLGLESEKCSGHTLYRWDTFTVPRARTSEASEGEESPNGTQDPSTLRHLRDTRGGPSKGRRRGRVRGSQASWITQEEGP